MPSDVTYGLDPDQIAVLLKAIAPSRVAHDQGRSNMQAFDVRAMLIRVFGFGGWDDIAATPTTLLFDEPTTIGPLSNSKPGVSVAYRADRILVIRNRFGREVGRYQQSAVGDAKMPDYMRADAHDLAMKAAESQALKRCAVNLGDQFGLGLYNDGLLDPVVRKLVGIDSSTGQRTEEASDE